MSQGGRRVSSRLPLAIAVLIFVGLSGWLSQRLGSWHEEVSVYPSHGARIVEAQGEGEVVTPVLRASCRDASPPRSVVSSERPVWSLCVGGRALPIMVSSYFAGWLYWPAEGLRGLHEDDALRLRALGVLLGVLELVAAHRLLARLGGRVLADAGALAIAASTPFVYVHALLVHYEFVPWMLLGAALLAWIPPRGRELGPTRLVGGAGLLGLSLAGNVKSAFLLIPLGLYAVFAGAHWPRRLTRWLPLALLAAAAPLVPLAAFARLDPAHGFSSQVGQRLDVASHKLLSSVWLYEPLNLVRYWSDVASYGDQIQGLSLGAKLTWILPALSLVFVGYQAILALGRRDHDRVSAALGLLILGYVPVVVLLYDQQPEANYAPLHTVLGAATGAFAVGAGRWLANRVARPAHAPPLAYGVVSLAVLGFAFNALRRGDPGSTLELSFNVVAQQALAARLAAAPQTGTVVTVTYNLAGVLDSLGDGRVTTVQAHPLFARCNQGRVADPACVEARLRDLLAMPDLARPLAVVAPTRGSMVDEAYVPALLPALERASAASGRHVETREDFATAAGVPVLSLWVVP